MQDLSSFAATYAGWDFTSVWSPPNQVGQNGGSATAYYPQLYALGHVVAVAPDTSSVYGTTPIAQYHGLHARDFITTTATIAGASAASDAGRYTHSASRATAHDPAYPFVQLTTVLTTTPATPTVHSTHLHPPLQ